MRIRLRDEKKKRIKKMTGMEVHYFEGKVCKKLSLIERVRLEDGRTVFYAILGQKVDLSKDDILKKFFDNWDKKEK